MTIEELLAPIEHERSTRLDPLDFPSTWTEREKMVYRHGGLELDLQIATIRSLIATRDNAAYSIRNVEAQLHAIDEWETWLNKWRAVLCDELLQIPARPPRAEMDRKQDLVLSIRSIDFELSSLMGALGAVDAYTLSSTRLGSLMRADGFTEQYTNELLRQYSFLPWKGSLKENEKKKRQLGKALDKAKVDYEIALRDIGMLLDQHAASATAQPAPVQPAQATSS